MQIADVEILIKKAEAVLGLKIKIERDYDGTWGVLVTRSSVFDKKKMTLSEVIEYLSKLATPPKPPKPETVTVTIPFDTAEYYVERFSERLPVGSILFDACKAAIEQYQ